MLVKLIITDNLGDLFQIGVIGLIKAIDNFDLSYKIVNDNIKIYDESKGRYESPKITKVLKNKGIIVSQKRVARRMKFLGLRSIIIKKFKYGK